MTLAATLAFFDSNALGWVFLHLGAASLLGVRVTTSVAPPPRWTWWLLLAGALLAFRWPTLWIPHQQNPDESQLIAGAIALRHDPVFRRSVDGGTAGPLDFYPLLPAA